MRRVQRAAGLAEKDLLSIELSDDGSGMDAETLARIRDPFFTTKHKKTGLGIPFLSQAAGQADGGLNIESAPGKGSRVVVTFKWSHIDRPALGNMAETLVTLIAGHPDIDIVYEERAGVVRPEARDEPPGYKALDHERHHAHG